MQFPFPIRNSTFTHFSANTKNGIHLKLQVLSVSLQCTNKYIFVKVKSMWKRLQQSLHQQQSRLYAIHYPKSSTYSYEESAKKFFDLSGLKMVHNDDLRKQYKSTDHKDCVTFYYKKETTNQTNLPSTKKRKRKTVVEAIVTTTMGCWMVGHSSSSVRVSSGLFRLLQRIECEFTTCRRETMIALQCCIEAYHIEM